MIGSITFKKVVQLVVILIITSIFSEAAFAKDFKGEIAVGSTTTSGNLDSAALNADLKVENKIDKFVNKANASFLYNKTKDDSDQDVVGQRFSIGAESLYGLSIRSYANSTFAYEDDRQSGFDYRTWLTIGLGYKLLNKEDLMLTLEAGPGVRHSVLDDIDKTKEDEMVARFSADFLAKFDSLTFTEKILLLSGDLDTTITSTTALEAPLSKKLAFKASLEIKNVDEPPADNEQTDVTTKMSIAYKF
ncbi:MAG: DUF481 domain-containing protein [Nitrospinota bacterium]